LAKPIANLHRREVVVDELVERPVSLQAPAHAGLREAAPDPSPCAAVLHPPPEPAGVVPEPVLLEPSPRHGPPGAGVGDGEREGGEAERGEDEQRGEEEVEPEEQRRAAASARDAGRGDSHDGRAEDERRRAEEALAVGGPAVAGRTGVDAPREHGRAEEEGEDVEGREDGVAATRPRHWRWTVVDSEKGAEKQGKAGEGTGEVVIVEDGGKMLKWATTQRDHRVFARLLGRVQS